MTRYAVDCGEGITAFVCIDGELSDDTRAAVAAVAKHAMSAERPSDPRSEQDASADEGADADH